MAKKLTAKRRIQAVDSALELIHKGVPVVQAWSITADRFGVHSSTLRLWVSKVKDQPRENWPEILKGHYVSNARKAEFSESAWQHFLQVYATTNPPSITAAYASTEARAQAENWQIPSIKTFTRRMNKEGIKKRTLYDGL